MKYTGITYVVLVLALVCASAVLGSHGDTNHEVRMARRARLERDMSRLEAHLRHFEEEHADESDSFLGTDSSGCPQDLSVKSVVKKIDHLAVGAKGGNVETRIQAQTSILNILKCFAPTRVDTSHWSKPILFPRGDRPACEGIRFITRDVLRALVVRLPKEKKMNYVGDYRGSVHEFGYSWIDWWNGKNAKSDVISALRKYLSDVESGCRRAKIEASGPIWTDNEWAHLQEAKVQADGSCDEVRKYTTDQAVDTITTILKSKDTFSGKQAAIDDILRCMAPWEEYRHGSGWGQTNVARDRRPLKTANCPLLYSTMNRLAVRHTMKQEAISTSSSPEAIFIRYLEAYGVKIDGTALNHMLDACNQDRPYRDWGTTNRDIIPPSYKIRMTLDKDFPKDDEGINKMRVELFCLFGLVVQDGKTNLYPGETTSYSVAKNKWDEAEGLTCTLNQGLDAVRRYKFNGHMYTCLSTAFWYKKFGAEKHQFITKPDESCPFSWVEASDSTESSPHMILKMKTREAFSQKETVADSCASTRAMTVHQGTEALRAMLKPGSQGNDFVHKLLSFFKCFVPTYVVSRHTLRTKDAMCDRLGGIINTWGQKYINLAAQNDFTAYETLFEYLQRNLRLKVTSDEKQKFDAVWEACGNEQNLNKIEGNFARPFGVGPLEVFQISFASGIPRESVPDDYGEFGFRPFTSCTEGISLDKERDYSKDRKEVPRWMRCPDAIPQGACTVPVRRDLRKPYDGIACYSSFFTPKCRFTIKYRRFGAAHGGHYVEQDKKECDLHVVADSKKSGHFTVKAGAART